MEIKDPNEPPEDHKLELLIAEMELEIGGWLCGARNARSDYKLKEPLMPIILDTIQDMDRINALVVQISDAAVKTFDAYDEDDWRLDAVVTDPLQAFGRAIEDYIEAAFAEERGRIEELKAENAKLKEALGATTQVLYTFCPGAATFTINGETKSIYDVINDAVDALEGTEDG